MNKVVILLSLYFVTSCATLVKVGESSISGFVVDAKTNKPIKGALILVYYGSASILNVHHYEQGISYTDSNGFFNIAPNPATILASVQRSEGPSIHIYHPEYFSQIGLARREDGQDIAKLNKRDKVRQTPYEYHDNCLATLRSSCKQVEDYYLNYEP